MSNCRLGTNFIFSAQTRTTEIPMHCHCDKILKSELWDKKINFSGKCSVTFALVWFGKRWYTVAPKIPGPQLAEWRNHDKYVPYRIRSMNCDCDICAPMNSILIFGVHKCLIAVVCDARAENFHQIIFKSFAHNRITPLIASTVATCIFDAETQHTHERPLPYSNWHPIKLIKEKRQNGEFAFF